MNTIPSSLSFSFLSLAQLGALPYRIFRESNGETLLEANVYAQNLANAYANAFYTEVTNNILPAFLGKKITCADNSLTKAFCAKLPEKLDSQTTTLQRWHESSEYSLCFHFRARCGWQKKSDHGTDYNTGVSREAYRSLGKISNGVLTEIYSGCEGLRTDFSAQEILEARKALEIAEKTFRDAESALCDFGKYDRY